MNNKAFTLVELLATLAILSVIMIIAIPNVIGILEKNKNTTYVEDAKKLVALADYEFTRDDSIKRPKGTTANECIIIRLSI